MAAAIVLWALAYPSENDPKNIKYILLSMTRTFS
jgi:hypothetical protein